MSARMSCPDEKTLRALLAGPAAEALAAHLDGCPACRAALDLLAGLNDSWPALARGLQEGQAPAAPALQQAMADLRRPGPPAPEGETFPGEQDGPAAPPDLEGLGHYQVQALVGRGGMGKVYRAF